MLWFKKEMVPMRTSDTHSKITELADSDEVYSVMQMKRKLYIRKNEDIIIGQAEGKANVVCFKDTVQFIIKKPITAANLIKVEIKAQKFNVKEYSSKDDIEQHENIIDPLLRLFMKEQTSDS